MLPSTPAFCLHVLLVDRTAWPLDTAAAATTASDVRTTIVATAVAATDGSNTAVAADAADAATV